MGSNLFVALVAVLLMTALTATAKTDEEIREMHSTASKYRSMAQACRGEIMKLCKPAGARVTARASLCLDEKVEEIEDLTCKTWVLARRQCYDDVTKLGRCNGAGAVKRACLSKLESSEVSPYCAESEFYHSVKFFASNAQRWRSGRGGR